MSDLKPGDRVVHRGPGRIGVIVSIPYKDHYRVTWEGRPGFADLVADYDLESLPAAKPEDTPTYKKCPACIGRGYLVRADGHYTDECEACHGTGQQLPAKPEDVREELAALIDGCASLPTEFIYDIADAILAKFPQHFAGWQPIATAPKDGTRVLVAQNNVWMAVARYWPCNNYWTADETSGVKLNPPTHWMPLEFPHIAKGDKP